MEDSHHIDTTHHLLSIANSTSDALIAINSEGRVISWNHAAELIFQYSRDEMIGQPLHAILPERFRDLHDQGIARVNSGGERHVIGKSAQLAGVRKDGTEFPLELTLSAWSTDEGMNYGGIIRDITDRVAMEEEIRLSEMRFRSILESAHDAVITADSKGDILSWNKAAENIFGYTESEVLGGPLTIIVPDRYKSLHEEGIKRVGQGGERHVIGNTVELSGLHKSGKEFPIELSLSSWEVNDQRFYSGIIRDITERKRDEEELKNHQKQLAEKAQQLETLNQEVSLKNEQLQGLSNKLAKYLSRQVYTTIFEGKRDVKIESYRKKLTIFFSDIEGFTELTERVESEVLTSVLNKYLNEMSKIALEHGGTIDKYIGDAIMIFFGDPESLGEKEDAVACVKMAIEMNKRLQEMRREWDVVGISTPLRIRMGVNTGFCTVGNFGSEERLDYTIVGGAVNLANRLESAAETDEILISEDTFSLVKDVIKCKARGQIEAKGFAYPVNTYVVIGEVDKLKEQEEELNAQLNGFNLSINYDKLNYADKMYAKELLIKAMSKLED